MTAIIIILIVYLCWLILISASLVGSLFRMNALEQKVNTLAAHNVALMNRIQGLEK